MWSVLRRHQGEYYERDAYPSKPITDSLHPATTAKTRGELSQRAIAMHSTRPYPKPSNPLVLTTPFGNFVYEKICQHLSNENVKLRRQAILNLLELYAQQAEHVVASLSAGIVDALVNCLSDVDDDMRTRACIALDLVVKQPAGQASILKGSDNKYLAAFLKAADDPCADVVVEALRLLASIHLAQNEYEGTQRLVKLGAIEHYIRKIRGRDDAVCCTACAALRRVFSVKEAFVAVLDAGGMEAITEAIAKRSEPMVVVEASEVVTQLAFFGAGKQAAVRHHTVAALIPHLQHENAAVQTCVSSAIGALTISEKGKAQAIEAGVIAALTDGVHTADERDVLVNLIQAVCNVSEHPVARPQFAGLVPRLEDIQSRAGGYEPLQQACARAIAVIQWVPGMPLA